jgi:hypothetical protein
MKCLSPKCSREAVSRGLCVSCYQSCSLLVRMGALTQDELIGRGLMLPVKQRGRLRCLTDSELVTLLARKFGVGGQVPSREAYIDAIGGSAAVLSKKHRGILDSIFPPDAKPESPEPAQVE